MADVTGGDLYHLWRVSEVLLPRVADVYYDANRLIGGAAAGNDEDGFGSTTPVYSGSSATYSPTGSAWAAVRDELQSMYAEIGTTILDAAQGVRMAREAYAEADTAAGEELNALLRDPTWQPSDPGSNPPVPGSEDDPGQPILPN
ncbi:hypothetical protein [Rhizomonospora bruguierae]|uniref:hypothetical protein n=1 Tax=Rhizomonospora bruguierae TaxID=1581705 RepID=UPI001BCE2709|nr:hypothetical protein [Micromonospora sp. NBRC 107566]